MTAPASGEASRIPAGLIPCDRRGFPFGSAPHPCQPEAIEKAVCVLTEHVQITAVTGDPAVVAHDVLEHALSGDWLARTIWEASRADEGTISVTGANIVATAIRAAAGVGL